MKLIYDICFFMFFSHITHLAISQSIKTNFAIPIQIHHMYSLHMSQNTLMFD